MANTRAGFTQDELASLDNMSIQQLDQLILSTRGLESNKAGDPKSRGRSGGTQQPSLPIDQQSDIAKQDLFESQAALDKDDSLDAIALRNFDPATLDEIPSYADGTAPDKALNKTPDGAAFARFKLAFSNKPVGEQVKYLEETYGKGNVQLSKSKNIVVKRDNEKWYRLDPAGMGGGDWMDKSLELTKDILADNADIAASVGIGILTAGAAAPLVAGLSGAAAVAGAGAVGASSGAASGMSKVLMGRLVGTYESTPEEMMKDIGIETLLGMAGNAFIPGVKYGARELGVMFKKTAPAMAQAAPEAKSLLTRVIGATSGQGDEIASHWVNNSTKVGNELAKYGKDAESGILANVRQTKEFADAVVEARRAYGKDIYSKFAEEAGEKFTPNVGRVFNSAAVNDAFKPDLVKTGILKWDGVKGVLNLNSVDDIMKSNPELGSIFTDPKARKLLTPVLNIVNTFNKVSPASGKAGAEQFLTFKNRLSAALRQSQAMASEAGLDSAYMDVSKFAGQLKSAYVNRAIDGVKHPELMQKLIATDKAYSQVKELIRPFEDTVRNANKIGIDAYKNLYKNTFEASKLSANKAVSGNRLQETVNLLSKYKPDLSEIVDDIGARKAALAASPWTRGGLDTAFTIGAALSGNPIAMAGMAVRSPKINYEAAKMAKSMYGGLEFVRKLPEASRKLLLQRPDAVAKLFDTVMSVPGIEAQVGQQLGQQLKGSSQNGQ